MESLAELNRGSRVVGIDGSLPVEVVSVVHHADGSATLVYRKSNGSLGECVLTKEDIPRLQLDKNAQKTFSEDPNKFKLVIEAHRIQLAHLFDPMMAIHSADVEPLPHQITAVYEEMLPRQPLRFLLADDPGAGKTIMAGLLIRELLMRADSQRILVIAPGSLVDQWQDELSEKFGLDFTIFSRALQSDTREGNAFERYTQLIIRKDQLKRDEALIEQCAHVGWDLIIIDEAHKYSAHWYGNEIKETRGFKMAKVLGESTKHFLLMTATPHSGKEEDFQLFLSLLDEERFAGRYREGAPKVDVSDIMRRMTKEQLVTFDGKPLFPERKAYTVKYRLSDLEMDLYIAVTDYVRDQMNRAERLSNRRKNVVGFAVTVLQRRLASSPVAIAESLRRRKEKLEEKLRDFHVESLENSTYEDILDDDDDDDELPDEERLKMEEEVLDEATAAQTKHQLGLEIEALKVLEAKAREIIRIGNDVKWDQLSKVIQEAREMRDTQGRQRKFIIFTEHKDTLNYLAKRLGDLMGGSDRLVVIHGGVDRQERRARQMAFKNDPDVAILVATDAAGEGVNLQVANLLVNYDLPWNPNRIEQRFGRIHRIGQKEICHMWNMVASGTREGAVFERLFEKLEIMRAALGGKVFDVLGEVFEEKPLRDLLMEAIRYGNEQTDLQATSPLSQVDAAFDRARIEKIIKDNALCEKIFTEERLMAVREDMDKANARRLQPHFVRSFFLEAFRGLSGTVVDKESGRYEIRHVPPAVVHRAQGGGRNTVLRRYERVCFEKKDIHVQNVNDADLLHPGHPLMQALIRAIKTDEALAKLANGTVFESTDPTITETRALVFFEHDVRGRDGSAISRRLQFVWVDKNGFVSDAGYAPHLDLRTVSDTRAVTNEEKSLWSNAEEQARQHALSDIARRHTEEVRSRREREVDKVTAAVKERTEHELKYLYDERVKWDARQDKANAAKHITNFQNRIDDLEARKAKRLQELKDMRIAESAPPRVIGTCIVYPGIQSESTAPNSPDAASRARVESLAMKAVVDAEQGLGHAVKDVSKENCGWDITANRHAKDGSLLPSRHIEVKGRAKGQTTITVTRNEIISALNQGDQYLLAIVFVDGDIVDGPHYVRNPFTKEPDWAETSVNWDVPKLLERAVQASQTV